MKKLFALALALVLALGLAACGAGGEKGALIKSGVLSVGCEVGYPPMEYTTEDGLTNIGFDIDVGKAIAALLGLEWELIDTSWEGIFASLDKGEYDCIISAVSITPDRQQRFILTEPYVANALCIVTRADAA